VVISFGSGETPMDSDVLAGMCVPAIFSGRLVDRFGAAAVSLVGMMVFMCSIALAASGTAFTNVLSSSLLLGLGWNLMYVSGTTLIARRHPTITELFRCLILRRVIPSRSCFDRIKLDDDVANGMCIGHRDLKLPLCRQRLLLFVLPPTPIKLNHACG
jgi:hypothetical protein